MQGEKTTRSKEKKNQENFPEYELKTSPIAQIIIWEIK